MFDLDKWLEIFHTIIANPLRTALTGVSVALGIFILIVMQGLGFGLQNGVLKTMQDDAVNSIFVYTWTTALPYKGHNAGRFIELKNENLDYVSDNMDVSLYSGRVMMWGAQVKYKNEEGGYGMRGVHPGHAELERTTITDGRFLNEGDMAEFRKVAVVGQTIIDELFKGQPAVGEYITVFGVQFRVVGTFYDPGSKWENRNVYVPISTAQRVFGRGEELDMFLVSTGDATLDESIELTSSIEHYLKEAHFVHPDDNRAISIHNNNETFSEMVDVFNGIRYFVWGIGVFTLLAGIIGVANIMSIVVKERTKEIGVRKALGATPFSIISLIIQESIFLTAVAGCLGLIMGVALLEVLANFIDHEFFTNPTVNFNVCLGALIMLTIAGAVSGLLPAIRAVRIRPVEALRDE